ncbi:universal stress protein [Chloroflexota bacterium]
MYERILVPLDGSELGEAALPHVEVLVTKLCPSLKVEVVLVRVISDLYHYVAGATEVTPVPYMDAELKPMKESAASYLSRIGEGLESKGATVKIMVTTGSAAEEIIRIANEINAGLIAMSTHGRTGIARWVLGSVVDRVIRATNVPVLVVRGLKVP